MMSNSLILTFFAVLAIGNHPSDGGVVTEFQPEFSKPLENVTVPVGRDATLTCIVRSLGGYRVGWVRADSKAIQAIHTHVITHNPRVSVSHSDHSMWHLHIKGVKEEDRGAYMCQINTDPMISQISYLEVVIPPDFVEGPEGTSSDMSTPEGGSITLHCVARGHPTPKITWKRENGQNITLRSPSGVKYQVPTYEGSVLSISKISRSDMGAYLCVSSNGVPPTIQKRIIVAVDFHPVIHVPNQLVGAPVNTDVTMECNTESYPRSIHYWVKENGTMIITGGRYEVHEVTNSMFEVKMILIIRNFQKGDAGAYHCTSKNSKGEVDSVIKLYAVKMGGDEPEPNSKSPGNAFDYDDADDFEGDLNSFDERGDGLSSKNPKLRNSYYANSNRPSQSEKDSESNSPGTSGSGRGKSNSISSSIANGINKKQQPTHHLNNKSQRTQATNNYQTVVVPVMRGDNGGGKGTSEMVNPNSAGGIFRINLMAVYLFGVIHFLC